MAGREEIAQARQTVTVIGGTGALGFGLAVRWAIAGVPIVIGSRDAGRAQAENLGNLRNALQPQTTLVDATVPLAAAIGGRATRTLGVWQGSAAQQALEMAPRGVTVVSALHTVSAAALSDPAHTLDEDVLMAGDDRKAKDDVAELIRRIPGLRPVDCGDLEIARILEQLTPMLISVNKRHKIKHSGIRITGV